MSFFVRVDLRNRNNYLYIFVIFLIVASCVAFGRIAGNDFINFDDDKYITENDYIQSGINIKSIKWAFTTFNFYWHPLTWLSLMADWGLFGTNAFGYHLVNLLLHIGTVIFLFLFLNKTTNNIWSAAFAAALFALHPLRVESVAWAAERKDVLSMFFGMACIYAYALYTESSKLSQYLLCLMLFAFGLMSKPTLVTLPFVLLLLDYWPLQRRQQAIDEPGKRFNSVEKLIGEKIPFICLAIPIVIITFVAQIKQGAVPSSELMPFFTRTANAIVSYVTYLEKTFWPANLAVFYPYEYSLPLRKVLISGAIIIVITLFVLYYVRKLPFLFVGWFWYMGTMIPLIGLIQAGGQAMADRHTYMPSIGIAIILSFGIPLLFQKMKIRKILFTAGIAAIAILAVLTWQQCGYWKNSTTLFSHALRATKDNATSHNHLGLALFTEGKTDDAIDHYNKIIHMEPGYVDAYNNRGNAYAKISQHQLAIEDYNEAIRRRPDYIEAYSNRGSTYFYLHQHKRAIDDYTKAIHLKPNHAIMYYNRGIVYGELGQYKRAIDDYDKAIRLKPDYADAYNNRGNIYHYLGQYQRAIEDYNMVIYLNPEHAYAYNNRGIVFGSYKKYKYALDDFNKVVRLKPDYAEAYNNLGYTYAILGQYQHAIENYNKAIRLKPDFVDSYMNRADAYLKQGNNTLCCSDARKACSLGNCKTLESAKRIGYCH